jgi:hypothetical protein
VRSSASLWTTILLVILLAPAVCGHVPLLPEENDNISSALHISDPTKSLAIYGFLGAERAQYYSFDSNAGQRIHLALQRSTNLEEKGFRPDLALLGPGLKTEGRLPDRLNLPSFPDGYGVMAISGNSSEAAVYEPFGPGSYYQMAELDLAAPVPGRYYVVIYNDASSSATAGHYCLTMGYREISGFSDRIIAPLKLISVYLWEGQSLGTILIPYFVAVIIGILIILRKKKRTAFASAGTIGALLFLGTCSLVLTQIVFNLTRAAFTEEVYISFAIAFVSAILGVISLRLAAGEAGLLQRIGLAVTGTLALLAGSGMILGALLVMAASVLPSRSIVAKQSKGYAPSAIINKES